MTKEDKKFLHKNPLCADCMKEGHYKRSTHVILNPDGSRSTVCDEHYKRRDEDWARKVIEEGMNNKKSDR